VLLYLLLETLFKRFVESTVREYCLLAFNFERFPLEFNQVCNNNFWRLHFRCEKAEKWRRWRWNNWLSLLLEHFEVLK
jgi:hypothetical protein